MDTETEMRRSRGIRLFYALPSDALLAVVSSTAAILAVAATLVASKMEAHPWLFSFMIAMVAISGVALLLMIAVLIFRTYLEYQRSTFDPATVEPLLREFGALETKREIAAQKCIDSIQRGGWGGVPEPERVEPVLDFFEDAGQQLATNQISDELAHHHFYTWLRMYYFALKPYIQDQQRVYGITTWEHIKPLFERTFLIEKSADALAAKEPTSEEMIKFFEME